MRVIESKHEVIRDEFGERWLLNGRLHREDGPAVTWAGGTKSWYLNGERHRIDGPAIVYPNGDASWYINGRVYRRFKSFCRAAGLSEAAKTMIQLQHPMIDINRS
ncbi:hypothetical protein UFOVP116_55 [uncultured Caudovirales phage]|uniref:Uncharacterized protein n=1 Tax=uncultured Caudovirales phage TaxID=2100421 RepID=A0A6J5L989_9CAUD|nr:hypothetical protein UFOVP116_55 [uncultured Caudovirales phage]